MSEARKVATLAISSTCPPRRSVAAVAAAFERAHGAVWPDTVVLAAGESGVEFGQRDVGFESAASDLQAGTRPFPSCPACQRRQSLLASPDPAPS